MLAQLLGGDPGEGEVVADRGEEAADESAEASSASAAVFVPVIVSSLQ
jgi:hypothetical protein